MKERNNKNRKSGFDYKGYVSNLGKKGTFYKDNKDSKGIEGTLVSIAEKGVYAMVAKMPFPVLFARADFGSEGTLKLNGKVYKIVEQKSSKKDKDSKGKGKNKKHFSDNGSYGEFGSNGSKKAKAMLKFLKENSDVNLDDDDTYEEVVEDFKTALKAFN